jgi:large subunit ribosomal protein L31
MKKDLHPQVYTDTTVTCACGNTFVTMSTLKEIRVDLCSACHPFFTGQQKFVDTEGRIQKFEKKRKMAETAKTAPKKVKAVSKTKEQEKPKAMSLKEMLAQTKKINS